MRDDPLGPDEVRLHTGEIVRFRLLVRPSQWNPAEAKTVVQSSRPLLWSRLASENARRLADLESVLLDLRFASRCCHLLSAAMSGRVALDADIQGSLWRSALIGYRRCFASGRRSSAPVPEVQEIRRQHEAFLSLANGHIAHQVDQFESFETFALGVPEANPVEVAGVHVLGISHQLGDPIEVVQLHELVKAVETSVGSELARLRAVVFDEARSLDAKALFSERPPLPRPMARIGGPTKTKTRRRR